MALAAALLMACGPEQVDDSADADGGSTDDTCVSLCGCPVDIVLDYSATVVDGQTGEVIEAVEVYCDVETTPISISDADGLVGFSIPTQESPGCGYARCNQLRFRPTTGPWEDVVVLTANTNGQQVPLPYPPD